MTQTTSLKAAVVASLLLVSSAFAGLTKAGDGVASFKGVGPAGFKIEGKTKSVDVKDDGKAITVVVSLKDLETGISLRDSHMREKYLEVDKFPEATLVVANDQVTWPEDGKSSEGQAKGSFTVHGVTKDVSFKYKITNSGGTYAVEGEAPVNFKDHGVNVPSYMGITVKPDITILSKFNAKKG
ncbi:MAG: YceI family protein [Myxococcaceae bacterium]|nr:YceI family protein [Myxococcaceae bacterium]